MTAFVFNPYTGSFVFKPSNTLEINRFDPLTGTVYPFRQIAPTEAVVRIESPSVKSIFTTGISGSINGSVIPRATAVSLHDHNTGNKIGDAVVYGPRWSYDWIPTVDDYSITSIDARANGVVSSPIDVHVVTLPEILLAAKNAYFSYKGTLLGTGAQASQVISLTSYGSLAETLAPSQVQYGIPLAQDAKWGGHPYMYTGAVNDHTYHLRSSSGVLIAQPWTLIWLGVRVGPTASSRIVWDGEDSSPRVILYSSASDTWTFSAGTALTSTAPCGSRVLVCCYANGAASRIDYLDPSLVWHTGTPGNAGTNGIAGVTFGNRYTVPAGPTGMGAEHVLAIVCEGQVSDSQKTQLARWLEGYLAGYPLRIGGGWLTGQSGELLFGQNLLPLTGHEG